MDATDSTQMESREKVLGKLTGLHAGEEIVYSGCVINCGAGHCVHKVRRKNGKITARVGPESGFWRRAES